MNNAKEQETNHKYLLWPIAVLLILAIGVFITTREVPKQQEVQSHAQVSEISVTPTLPVTEPTQVSSQSANAVMNIAFSLSGISNLTGNTKPMHPTRDITLLFYDRDTNTQDSHVLPLYTFKTTVLFDGDPASPTYTQFTHKNLSLAGVIPNGTFQVGLKTDQAIRQLFKTSNASVLGAPVLVGSNRSYDLAFGQLITGDIVPISQGDSSIDIADYNELTNCFGEQFTTTTCTAKGNADLDDNGVVDGIDYNIMLRSMKTLLVSESTSATATLSPSPANVVSPTVAIAPTKNTSQPVSSLSKFGLFFVVTIIFLAGFMMFFRRTFPKIPLPQINGKVYFISQSKTDEKGWFTLADDNKQIRGHYEGGEIKDGFARVHGKTKIQDGIKYLEITKIDWED